MVGLYADRTFPKFWSSSGKVLPGTYFFYDVTAPGEPGSPRYRDFTIRLRHNTLSRTHLNEGSVRHSGQYLTTNNTHRHIHPCRRRDPNSQSQVTSGRRPMPYTARPMGSAKWKITGGYRHCFHEYIKQVPVVWKTQGGGQ